MAYKQVIIARQDLKLPKGKLGAQTAHASVEAVLLGVKRSPEKVQKWRQEGMKKIILKVEDEKELLKYFQMAKDQGFLASLITDAGRTIVEPGTKTCIAIGPEEEGKVDSLTGELKMM